MVNETSDENEDGNTAPEDDQDGSSPDTNGGERDGCPTPAEQLRERLDALKKEAANASFKKQLVDDNIKELEKLVTEIDKSKQALSEAYPDLRDEETRLQKFFDYTKPDLAKILQQEGLQAVIDRVNSEIRKVDTAEDALVALTGRVPDAPVSSVTDVWKRGAIGDAKAAVTKADTEFAAAEKNLADVQNLASSVADRQKRKAAAADEILKQGRGGQPALAYWLLTETGRKDSRNQVILDGTEFFSGMTEPKLLKAENLEQAISDAWRELEVARVKRNTEHASLKALEEELKVAEKNLSDLKKDFSNNVKDALVAWQADQLDPLS